jgi:glycosyltransferase involved in cell wall biosynthesis
MSDGRGLFISAYFPSADIPAAGNKLAARALEKMAARREHVDVVAFLNPAERAWRAKLPNLPNITAHIHNITLSARLAAAAAHPLLPSGAAVRKRISAPTMRRLAGQHVYEEIRLEFTQSADALPSELRGAALLRVHDVVTELYDRQRRGRGLRAIIGQMEWLRARRWEKRVFSEFEAISALTSRDADAVARTGRVRPVRVEAPADFYTIEGRSPDTVVQGTMLFWANFGRAENQLAARFLIDEVLPRVRVSIPRAHLILAGADPPAWSSLVREGVSWTGFLESPGEVFRSCAIGVVPLFYGAGIKIKTLEFLASGIPTVSTSIGAEGIEPSGLLHIADGTEAFADMCVSLLAPDSP